MGEGKGEKGQESHSYAGSLWPKDGLDGSHGSQT